MAFLLSAARSNACLRRVGPASTTVQVIRQVRRRAYDYASADDGPGQGGQGGQEERDWQQQTHRPEDDWPGFNLRSPRQLVQYLDSYVVGQERAKKILAVAVFNHYNRVRANLSAYDDPEPEQWGLPDDTPASSSSPSSSSSQHVFSFPSQLLGPRRSYIHQRVPGLTFEKSNVLVIGPTGTGKTLLARTLARVLDVPFAMSDATTFTQAGYVGEDVESCIQRLLQAANWDVSRARIGIVCIDECDKIARRQGDGNSKDVSGEGVQQALLRMLEGSLVTVSSTASTSHLSHSHSPPSDLSSGTLPGRSSRRTREGLPGHGGAGGKPDSYQIDTSNILFILSGAFVGLDKVVRRRVAKGSIGFDAPLMKSAADDGSSGSGGESESKIGKDVVGKNFLPFFTPNVVNEEFDLMDLVEPGDLVKYGFIPEFVSRLPVLSTLHPLPPLLLYRVLTEVRNSLVSQFSALFSYSGAEMRFTSEALWEVAVAAWKKGTGARGLRGILENVLLEPMYDVPSSSVRYVLITAEVVRGEKQALYWSRGEANVFWSMHADEEMKWAQGKGRELMQEEEDRDDARIEPVGQRQESEGVTPQAEQKRASASS